MPEDLDGAVRRLIYTRAAAGRFPAVTDIAGDLGVPLADAAAALGRLAAARALVLQPDGEILMAEPFSAVPTAFYVTSVNRSWFASCIWDALGIPAMLRVDAVIETSCQCCGQRLSIRAAGSARIVSGSGVVHLAVPAKHWWNDIVFT